MSRFLALLLGFWLLISMTNTVLVASYVGSRMSRIDDRLDEFARLEARRALNASLRHAVEDSAAAKRCASQLAILRGRQDRIERTIVSGNEQLASHAQVEALTRAMRKRFQLTIHEMRYPNAYLPPPK